MRPLLSALQAHFVPRSSPGASGHSARSTLRTLGRGATVGAALFVATLAHARYARSGDAQVTFTATGPGGLKILGTTSELTVDDRGDAIAILVPLRGLDTKIELRNKHMREKYLEVAKYPNAELVVQRSEIRAATGSGPVQAEANGTLKLHGQSRPVRFSYVAKRADDGGRAGGDALRIDGKLGVDIREFGIEQPSFMGATVKPNVDVTASFVVKDG
jgi:polyisoprenoid-binding protein YceI